MLLNKAMLGLEGTQDHNIRKSSLILGRTHWEEKHYLWPALSTFLRKRHIYTQHTVQAQNSEPLLSLQIMGNLFSCSLPFPDNISDSSMSALTCWACVLQCTCSHHHFFVACPPVLPDPVLISISYWMTALSAHSIPTVSFNATCVIRPI